MRMFCGFSIIWFTSRLSRLRRVERILCFLSNLFLTRTFDIPTIFYDYLHSPSLSQLMFFRVGRTSNEQKVFIQLSNGLYETKVHNGNFSRKEFYQRMLSHTDL
jgi:hypothetical protein